MAPADLDQPLRTRVILVATPSSLTASTTSPPLALLYSSGPLTMTMMMMCFDQLMMMEEEEDRLSSLWSFLKMRLKVQKIQRALKIESTKEWKRKTPKRKKGGPWAGPLLSLRVG